MPRRIAIAFVACLLGTAPAWACINEIGTDRHGRHFEVNDHVGRQMVDRLRAANVGSPERTREIISNARDIPDLNTLTSLAILLMRQGQAAKAIPLLVAVEKKWPGHYETASNLGTALELAGHDRVALRWILIGMARKPDSHHGSEWLHARILEAKVAGAVDGASITGLDFGDAPAPVMPRSLPTGSGGRPVTPPELDTAFRYQLGERIPLVPAPDPVVANLLSDWATLNLAGGPAENAVALYAFAEEFGAPQTALVRARRALAAEIVASGREVAGGKHDCPICR